MKATVSGFHFSMGFVGSIVFALINLILRYSNIEASAVDFTSLIRDYETKICNNEPTCNLTAIPNLTADKLTFPYRDCMCDSECSEYDDCCTDSHYHKAPKLNNPPKTYFCSPEAKVYMVVSCLPDYTDEKVIANCRKALKPLEENNFALILPVTSKRTTYANPYCALCNKDENFTPWGYASGCGEPAPGFLEQKAAEVRKESSTALPSKISTSTSTSKQNGNPLNINVHVNPGAIFGNKDPNAGFTKEISIPTFSDLGTKLANKSLGSETRLFSAKTGRKKRQATSDNSQSSGSINIYQYARKINEIMKVVKYDASVKELVANFENKTLICQLGTRMPESVSKHVRKCVPNVISECPNDDEMSKRCKSYLKLVHDTLARKSYRNVDCAKCNGVNVNAVKLTGCQPLTTRVGAQSLFANDGKGNTNNEVCKDPVLGPKLC